MNPSGLNLNPALLLNPKAYRAEAAAAAAAATSNESTRMPIQTAQTVQTSAPVEFQFSTPSDGYLTAGNSPSHQAQPAANGTRTPPTTGFGSMIERANNVEHRAFVPQPKRRKLQNEEMHAGQSFASGSGGMLGGHIKERREAAINGASQQTVVDLTDAGRCPSGGVTRVAG